MRNQIYSSFICSLIRRITCALFVSLKRLFRWFCREFALDQFKSFRGGRLPVDARTNRALLHHRKGLRRHLQQWVFCIHLDNFLLVNYINNMMNLYFLCTMTIVVSWRLMTRADQINCSSDPCHMAWLILFNRQLLNVVWNSQCSNTGQSFSQIDRDSYFNCSVRADCN